MFETHVLLTLLAVVSALVEALLVKRSSTPRTVLAVAAGCALLCSVAGAASSRSAAIWLAMDDLAAAPAVLITGLLIALACAVPRPYMDAETCARLLVSLAGILVVYAAGNVVVLFAGWALSTAAFASEMRASSGAAPFGSRSPR